MCPPTTFTWRWGGGETPQNIKNKPIIVKTLSNSKQLKSECIYTYSPPPPPLTNTDGGFLSPPSPSPSPSWSCRLVWWLGLRERVESWPGESERVSSFRLWVSSSISSIVDNSGGGSGGGRGGGGGDALARWAHGEGGGRELHVEWVGVLQSPQLLKLLVQPSVLFR